MDTLAQRFYNNANVLDALLTEYTPANLDEIIKFLQQIEEEMRELQKKEKMWKELKKLNRSSSIDFNDKLRKIIRQLEKEK